MNKFIKTLIFLCENVIISAYGTILSFALRFYETPLGRILEAIKMQLLRNFVIIFICITFVRLLVPCIKKRVLKWNWEKTARYEKWLTPAMYGVMLLIIYVLLESIDTLRY